MRELRGDKVKSASVTVIPAAQKGDDGEVIPIEEVKVVETSPSPNKWRSKFRKP